VERALRLVHHGVDGCFTLGCVVQTIISSSVESFRVVLNHLFGQESATSRADLGGKSDTQTLLLINEGRYESTVAFLEVLFLLRIKLCLVELLSG